AVSHSGSLAPCVVALLTQPAASQLRYTTIIVGRLVSIDLPAEGQVDKTKQPYQPVGKAKQSFCLPWDFVARDRAIMHLKKSSGLPFPVIIAPQQAASIPSASRAWLQRVLAPMQY
ncbi:hypothetical protein HaLaN_13536, partial [Haematococcus lacustris]